MACWFSDVSHEVLPVTSGLRIVLAYNLVTSEQPDEPRLSATLNALTLEQATGVQEALRVWLDSRGPQSGAGTATISRKLDYFCYPLDRDYSKVNLALDQLQGVDLNRIQCLQDACSCQNATLFLGILEKWEEGRCASRYHKPLDCSHNSGEGYGYGDEDSEDDESWHEFIEVNETGYLIKNIVSIEGKSVLEEVSMDGEDIQSRLIQYDEGDDAFLSARDVEEDAYKDSDEYGAKATQYYRMAVAIVVPSDLVDVFLTDDMDSDEDEAQSQLPKYLARCSELDPQSRQSAMNMVRYLAEIAWSTRFKFTRGWSARGGKLEGLNEETVTKFVNVAFQNKDYELFRLVFFWMNEYYGTKLFAAVKGAMEKDQSFEFSQFKDSFLHVLSAIPVARRMEQLKAWGLGPNPNDVVINPQIRKWASDEVVTAAISACVPVPGTAEHPSAKDGAAIVSMVHTYGDFEYLKSQLLPIIRKQISNVPFSLACLTDIILLSQHDGVFPRPEASKICYSGLKAAVTNMDVSKLQSQEASDATRTAAKRAYTCTLQELTDFDQASSRRIVSSRLLADLLFICLRFKWNALAFEFCEKVVSYHSSAPSVDDHRTLWIPFLREIPSVLKDAKVHLSWPQYQSLARAILESFVNKYVGPEPGRIDYSGQGPITCRCEPCRRLDGLLASKDRVWHFQAVKKDRQHIQEELSSEEELSSGFGLSFETIQNLGFAWMLVITKKNNSAEKLRAAWNERFKAAQKIFGDLNNSNLKYVVGGEKEWAEITGMEHLKYTGPVLTEEQTVSQPGGTTASGERGTLKRKAEEQMGR